MSISPPPKFESLRYGTELIAGLSKSIVIADFDFETYSEAGFVWDGLKFKPPLNATIKGLRTVGLAVYAEHPSTEVLSLAYNLKDGYGRRLWSVDDQLPYPLFEHIREGKLLEAWNVGFEYWIWQKVCVPRYGFPPLELKQLRCAMAKSRAFGLPGSLNAAGDCLKTEVRKDKNGKRLLDKFSIPRNPTKKDSRKRILLKDDPKDADLLYKYNLSDIAVEAEISSLVCDLAEPLEIDVWLSDQNINRRGVRLDHTSILACIDIVEQAHVRYNSELSNITGGAVSSASEIFRFKKWLMSCGTHAPTLDDEVVTELLKIKLLKPQVRRALEIRKLIGSAAVKKIYTMINQSTIQHRVHNMFMYYAARTGRWAAMGPQPQNMPNSGPDVHLCVTCHRHFNIDLFACPWCGCDAIEKTEWNPNAVDDALQIINTKDLNCVQYYFGDAIETVSACLRGLFISAENHDLICSDYSSIEAVVLAALAGEQWRLDVFNSHGKIYELSASKIIGTPFETYTDFKKETGKHHVDRKLGKVAELASGYGGWIGAWKNFGADEFLSENAIKQAILAWRRASPAIVEFWGGQQKDWFPHLYGLEGAVVNAILHPGVKFDVGLISYVVVANVLYCTLPSGRHIVYHNPKLTPSTRRQDTYAISFEGWNTNPKYGVIGWVRMETYGGKLTENVVQGVARDILAHAIVSLEKAGYPIVLHVHDEIVAEIPEGFGSIEEFEKIMSTLPAWASGWPIKAQGGWRAKRYRK